MIEVLLILLIASLWLLCRPAKDWYIVEWRTCSEESLCSTAFSSPANFGFGKSTLSAHELVIDQARESGVRLRHANGGTIGIDQTPFEDLDAARLHFESMKPLFPVMEDRPFQKLYLWRVVARSRRNALTVPPSQYSSKDGEVLLQYPEHLWYKPRSE